MSEEKSCGTRGEDRFFLALVVGVTIALILLIRPFFGAVLWAVVAALLFAPVYGKLKRKFRGRPNLAASATLLIIIILFVAPAIFLGSLMLKEVAAIYERVRGGHIDFGKLVLQVQHMLPDWATRMLDRMGLYDLDQMRERIVGTVGTSVQFVAARAFDISQSAFGFLIALGVMLYLAYFLLRDGQSIAYRIEEAIPLEPKLRRDLLDRIVTVIRATIKGSFVVAILQGAIGGAIFWFLGVGGALLWGVAMGFFSLLPAIGTGLVWVPVAIYLLVTGAFVKAIILILCGLFVIGMVDNVVRPVLVGRDTQMPDYVIFISTLGGIELFGFNGFVVGPVIAALFVAVWETVVSTREAREPEARNP